MRAKPQARETLQRSSLYWRRRIKREPPWFAVEASNLYIVEQERWSDDRARNPVLGRAKSAKGRAAKAFLGVQHVGKDRRIVADRQDVAERPQREAFEDSAAR